MAISRLVAESFIWLLVVLIKILPRTSKFKLEVTALPTASRPAFKWFFNIINLIIVIVSLVDNSVKYDFILTSINYFLFISYGRKLIDQRLIFIQIFR